jgi:hypothetical protein
VGGGNDGPPVNIVPVRLVEATPPAIATAPGSMGRMERPSTAEGTVAISTAELGYLLEGLDWRMPEKTWRPTAAG